MKLARPAFRVVRAVLRRAKRIVGHEHLVAVALVALKDILRIGALVHLPSGCQLRERDYPCDCGLAHLGWTREDNERVALERCERPQIRARCDEHPGELLRC